MAQQVRCFDSVSRVCTCSVPPPSDVPKLPSTYGSTGFLSSKSNVTIICVLALLVVAGILISLVIVYRRHQRKCSLFNNVSDSKFPESGHSNTLPMQTSKVALTN